MKQTLLAALAFASVAHAHFQLLDPTPMYQQGVLGDPQKAPPCGADGTEVSSDAGTKTYAPGDMVNITIDEKVFHPGHYRVSLGETGPDSLPPEPAVTAGAMACGTAVIESPAVYPVLADDQLDHTSPFTSSKSFSVQLPTNVNCTNCTLQVIEFMSDHGLNVPGGCFYHHCVNINIAGSTGTGGGTQSGTGGGSASSGGGTAAEGGGAASTGGGTAAAGGGTASTGGGTSTATGGGTSSATGGGAGTTDDGGEGGGAQTGGCSCNGGGEAAALLALGAVVTLIRARRRRS